MEFYPAIQADLGSWKYYSTKMTARNLAHNVQFASEVWDASSLDLWIQRTLSDSRATREIAAYLANHDDRFFNSIVVAAIDGNPHFSELELADDPRLELLGDKRFLQSIGLLRFDGTQKYYALDGQHRLRAIKALLEKETDYVEPDNFQNEEFSVLIVVPKPNETKETFLQKYRRLFGHLNRYAKPMDLATTLIMEEDDALAIVTRRLLLEHSFFSQTRDGEPIVKAKGGKNLSTRDTAYFTSIIALYDATKSLLYAKYRQSGNEWGTEAGVSQKLKEFVRYRPGEIVLEELYTELSLYWDAILDEIPDLREDPAVFRSEVAEDEVEPESGKLARTNHLLFRPLGTDLLAGLVRELLDQKLGEQARNPSGSDVSECIRGLGGVEWRLHQPPWRHLLFVYDEDRDKWKMRSEERKAAMDVARSLLRWICQAQPFDDELLETLRRRWESTLYGAPDDEVDEMWSVIEGQAESFATDDS